MSAYAQGFETRSDCMLCNVGGKGQSSSFQEGASHTFTLKLGSNKISILYQIYIYIYIWYKFNFGPLNI